MAINQGSILDHLDKPAIRRDDAVYQSLTATSDGKVEVTGGVGAGEQRGGVTYEGPKLATYRVEALGPS